MYENSHVTIYGYIEAWTYHPMLNISVIPQRRYNLAPSVYKKLYDSEDAKVASVTSGFNQLSFRQLPKLVVMTLTVISTRI